jgi:DNA-binding MarR family transcriptional regulator
VNTLVRRGCDERLADRWHARDDRDRHRVARASRILDSAVTSAAPASAAAERRRRQPLDNSFQGNYCPPIASQAHPSALEDHLGYWLRFVSNHVSHAFRRKVEAAGVTVSEWVVLRQLHGPGPATGPGPLIQSLGMSKGAVSKLLDRLAERGLLTRVASEVDRRQQHVVLTARGRALVPRLARLADDNDHEFFGHLPAAQRTALLHALQDLVRVHQLRGAPVD